MAVLLLSIIAPIVGFCVCTMFYCALLCVLSSFTIILMVKRKQAGCSTLFVFQMSCDSQCSVALPHGAMCWSVLSVVCERPPDKGA